jgi:hypothetical protein
MDQRPQKQNEVSFDRELDRRVHISRSTRRGHNTPARLSFTLGKGKMMRSSLCLLLFIVNAAASVNGADYAIRFDREEAYPVQLPTPEIDKEIRAGFEYDKSNSIVGFVLDLNGDRQNDYLVRANESLCGTGGCPYEIIEGSSNKSIGSIFGNPLIIDSKKIQGYSIIHTYGHSSVESGTFSTLVFDGGQYVEVSSIGLTSESLVELFNILNKVPTQTKKKHAQQD